MKKFELTKEWLVNMYYSLNAERDDVKRILQIKNNDNNIVFEIQNYDSIEYTYQHSVKSTNVYENKNLLLDYYTCYRVTYCDGTGDDDCDISNIEGEFENIDDVIDYLTNKYKGESFFSLEEKGKKYGL